ncbi:MAG TPA: fused MFS/spermidine synthase [Patescibacteria group bacterium]|nr:fused MFS/spermidine synthase [Patescibacteria group bacterium]
MTGEAAMRTAVPQWRSPTVALFSLTLFVSAALMFTLQPMLGKMLLPLVGGTPSGWLAAMAFFQVMLLIGYAFAYRLSLLPVRLHIFAYLGVMLIGAAFLPPMLVGTATGSMGVFGLLAKHCALPFIALAMTSSTLQRVFMSSSHRRAQDPYFLYAASNLGSFAGLLLYPLAAEILFDMPQQAGIWTSGYILLLALGATCALHVRQSAASSRAPADSNLSDWRWVLFAFIPSSLMMGVTSEITTAILAAPLLWVVPLSVYLLTFVVAFSNRLLRAAAFAKRLHPAAACLALGLVFLASVTLHAPLAIMAVLVLCFGIIAFAFHSRLAALRPLGHPAALARFYLAVSLGGALGGLLNVFVAPVIFNRPLEFPVVMLASLLFAPALREKFSTKDLARVLVGAVGLAVWAALRHYTAISPGSLEIFVIALFVIAASNARLALAGCALLALNAFVHPSPGPLDLHLRNFYGMLRVYDRSLTLDGDRYDIRYLGHGTTVHGLQSLDPDLAQVPTAYFSKGGPVGDIFETFKPLNVAVLGLGAGTLACHHAPGRKFTFIEIDPDVIRIAQDKFTFLSGCPGAAPHRIIKGDGRLELAKLAGEKFDLIVLDAFSSDMVPVHLLSTDAVALYKSLLTEHGVLAFNISNNHVMLATTLAAIARDTGMNARFKDYQFIDPPLFLPSEWLVMAKDEATLAPLSGLAWATPPAAVRSWTDDYSNIISVMRF